MRIVGDSVNPRDERQVPEVVKGPVTPRDERRVHGVVSVDLEQHDFNCDPK